MKINPNLIISAIGALKDYDIVKEGSYEKEFPGYISSFGAAIIQSGLLPAVIFYEQDSESAENRHNIIKAIIAIVNSSLTNNEKISGKLAKYIIKHDKLDDTDFLNLVTDSAVALKLALRMFKKKK